MSTIKYSEIEELNWLQQGLKYHKNQVTTEFRMSSLFKIAWRG
jgi:hypothetical protein